MSYSCFKSSYTWSTLTGQKVIKKTLTHYDFRTSQKFCNILVTRGTIWQVRMLLPWSCMGWTTLICEKLSLPETQGVLPAGFISVVWNRATKSTIFRLTRPCLIIEVHATRAKFLQSAGYCALTNKTLTFRATKVFDCFRRVKSQFELVKLPNQSMLHVYLDGIQITHVVKQCTTCQHTKYHDTTKHSCFVHMINVPLTSSYQCKKILDSSN